MQVERCKRPPLVTVTSNVFQYGFGELAEWLRQQFAKLSFSDGRIGSNPILSANFKFDAGLGV